jgi:pseudouridine kinase
MRGKEYIVTIGSANMDVGYSHASLNYADSNPENKIYPGGVGRNIAHNLALLGKILVLTAVGDDFYGQSLLAQTNQSGVHVINVSFPEKIHRVIYRCWIIPVKCWWLLMI